jgi:putative ABC transport system permease protein
VGRYGTNYRLEKDRSPAHFVAIEPHEFGRVAFFRPDFAPQGLDGLLSQLAADPRNVLVPRSYLRRTASNTGERIRIALDVIGTGEWVELPFVIAGVYDYFPTVFTDERIVFVGNLNYLIAEIGGVRFFDVWLRTTPDAQEDDIVAQVLQHFPVEVAAVRNARLMVRQRESLPERVGFFGTLSAGFLGVGALSVVCYALFAFLSLKRRTIEIGVLRAIGLAKSSMARSLIYEQFIMLASAVLGAMGLGLTVANTFIPLVEVARTQRAQTPPYIIHMAWSDLILILILIGATFVIAMGVVSYVVVRQRIGETIKLADF